MSWKIRHEGSPQYIEGLTLAQVVEGLSDGLWEPTDEVMDPQGQHWVAIENHPQLADIAADLEPPPPPVHDDESRLDMNPLIDVALVLLIFFIITTTYEAIRKVMDMPGVTAESTEGPIAMIDEAAAKQLTIWVTARQQADGSVSIFVEDQPVPRANLLQELRRFASQTRKTELLIDAGPGVEWGLIVEILDAGKGAGMEKGHFLAQMPP
ncbi:MAG: ExbD/TolR family protein [Gemmataceae bacterium]